MSGSRVKALRREFVQTYGFAPDSRELRQLKRCYTRNLTRKMRLSRPTPGSFFPVDRKG